MTMRNRICVWLIGAGLILGVAGSPGAQEPAAPSAPAPPPMSPGVAALMATNPTTPMEKVRAAKILAGLDRPDLAKQLIGQVLGANLDEAQLFELEQRFGTPVFVSMGARGDLAPEGRQLANAVLAAAKAVLEDSDRLEGLVRQLSSPQVPARTAAMQGLLQGGRVSIGLLMNALADPARAEEHEMVRAALGQFGRAAVGPLLAALAGGDPALKAEAIQALAGLGARESVPFFLALAVDPQADKELRTIAQRGLATFGRPVPDLQVATAMLLEAARDYLDGRHRFREDLDGNVSVWTWDASARQAVSHQRPVAEAQMLYAARLLEDAHHLAPADGQVRILYLTCLLEQAAQAAGLENRLPIAADSPAGIAAAAGLGTIEAVLAYAMEAGRIGAAIAAVRILEERGSALEQLYKGSFESPLVKAVQHDDPRLRFAALEAVVGLEPTAPFPGSAAVVDAVIHFATSQGERKALVAGPSTSESQRLAGHLAALGFVGDTARSGRELIELAQRSADYELALVDEGIQQPKIEFLLQQLRHDNRTAGLPVGVWARDGRLPRAQHASRRDPLATAFTRAHSQQVVDWQAGQVLRLVESKRLPAQQRMQQASQAMQWLADWSAGHPVFRLPKSIDAVYEALFLPELAPQATAILANTGTPEAQKALVELASRWTQPLQRRKAAVEALWDNTTRYGVLLTSAEILLQYDRYNDSEKLDRASQQILSAILNCLEAPTKVAQDAKKTAATTGPQTP